MLGNLECGRGSHPVVGCPSKIYVALDGIFDLVGEGPEFLKELRGGSQTFHLDFVVVFFLLEVDQLPVSLFACFPCWRGHFNF